MVDQGNKLVAFEASGGSVSQAIENLRENTAKSVHGIMSSYTKPKSTDRWAPVYMPAQHHNSNHPGTIASRDGPRGIPLRGGGARQPPAGMNMPLAPQAGNGRFLPVLPHVHVRIKVIWDGKQYLMLSTCLPSKQAISDAAINHFKKSPERFGVKDSPGNIVATIMRLVLPDGKTYYLGTVSDNLSSFFGRGERSKGNAAV